MPDGQGAGPRLEAALQRLWWRPRLPLAAGWLVPLSGVYALLRRILDLPWQTGLRQARRAPVPVVVVGNLVAGGAGKTPTVVAIVGALRDAGYRPGVVSRGYGRRGTGVAQVTEAATASEVGDEPLLIARRTRVPVFVGRRRIDAARALCAAHPAVDVIVCDDGLQHRPLARDVEVVVIDGRGVGNGWLLPAGPLREPLSAARGRLVLYNAEAPSTPLPGAVARRRLGAAVPLASWWGGSDSGQVPLEALRERPVVAAAGIAEPGRFFRMLEAEGLEVSGLPLPDHFDWVDLPWPPGTADVLVTEKDAVKIDAARVGATRVWVVGLDLALPDAFVGELLTRLRNAGLS